MSVFFTSDTHFWHANILKYCLNRKGSTVEEMNEIIIKAWNNKVSRNEEIYHLGDFAFAKVPQVSEIIDRLNGRIHLIRGNHDKMFDSNLKFKLASFNDYKEIKLDKKKIIMMHYPIHEWNGKHYNFVHLHGHCHGNNSHHPTGKVKNRLDVGVDTRSDMAPWSWEELKEVLNAQD